MTRQINMRPQFWDAVETLTGFGQDVILGQSRLPEVCLVRAAIGVGMVRAGWRRTSVAQILSRHHTTYINFEKIVASALRGPDKEGLEAFIEAVARFASLWWPVSGADSKAVVKEALAVKARAKAHADNSILVASTAKLWTRQASGVDAKSTLAVLQTAAAGMKPSEVVREWPLDSPAPTRSQVVAIIAMHSHWIRRYAKAPLQKRSEMAARFLS